MPCHLQQMQARSQKSGDFMLTTLATLQDATALAIDETRGCVWVTQRDGNLLAVDLAGGGTTAHQVLAPAPAGIDLRGSVLAVVDTSGRVSTLDPDAPDAAGTMVGSVGGRPGQLALTAVAKRVLVVVRPGRRPGLGGPPGLTPSNTLGMVDLASGAVSRVRLDGLTGVAVAGGATYVARSSRTTGRGSLATLRGRIPRVLVPDLPPTGRVGTAGTTILVCHPTLGSLTAAEPATGDVTTVSTVGVPGTLMQAQGLADGRIAVLTTDALALVDDLADLANQPYIEPLTAPLFVASWTPVRFSLTGTALTPAEVHFVVPDGPEAGVVSYARPSGAEDPEPLLIAGGRVGGYRIDLVETASATVLASTAFEVTDHWDDEETGPSGTYVGASSFDGASGWGGGLGTPQNQGVHPHVGSWRSLVLMVDTSTARWPSAAATMTANRTAILGHVVDGVTFNGANRSARAYYEENSRYVAPAGPNPARGLTLTARNSRAYGPVSLPNAWTSYFAQKKDKDGTVTDDRWSSKGTTVQTIISRALSDGVVTTADLSAVDVLIIVPFSPDATGGRPARFVWPHAHDPVSFLAGTNPATDMRNLAYTFVPLDFDVHDGRQAHSTLSHELGHTLGLPDLYDFPEYAPDITDRLTTDWDMMAGSRDRLPHYTLSNKMRMNWVPSSQLKLYNFQGSGGVNDNITLHAAELGDPPGGRVRGIEIRLGDGWNYYVEYRSEQAGLVSDDLVTDRRVVITDVTSDTFTAPVARPPIVFVQDDADGDGPLLGVNADLEQVDPGTQMDLVVKVVSTAVDNAVVNVKYGANGRPEPGIRPWTGGPNWQSPDIEVRNDRATADPGKWFNVPWLGHDNNVVAKVKNSGDLLAKGVTVDFYVTEYSAGDGPWIPLGNDKHDVPAGATVEFTTTWAPSAADGRHYCVIVRIRNYRDPANAAIGEQNIYDNEARSNYTKFVSASSSPSTRAGTQVLLGNPFAESTLVHAYVRQTHGQHRVFLEHQWLRVDGKGTRPVGVWDEALYGTPEWDLVSEGDEGERPNFLWEVPNHVSVTGWARRPFEADCGAQTLTGGVALRVDAGRATRVEFEEQSRDFAIGNVRYQEDGAPVTSGTVLVELSVEPGKYVTATSDVRNDGTFRVELSNPFGPDARTIEAHFLGAFSAAESTTGSVPVN